MPRYAGQAAKLCALGATDADIAGFFDVAISTISLWKTEFPEFSEAIKTAKENLDAKVERSLYERAMGYSHPDVDIRAVALGENKGSQIIQTPTVKHYAPSELACIFWLKNRKPKEWRDRHDVAVQNPDGTPLLAPEIIAAAAALAAGVDKKSS